MMVVFKLLGNRYSNRVFILCCRYLDNNNITSVPENSFKRLKILSNLRLDANLLTKIPVKALSRVRTLEAM